MLFSFSVSRREYSLRARLALRGQFLHTTSTVNGETDFGQGQAREVVKLVLLNQSLEKSMGFHCLESREISLTRLNQPLWISSEAFWKLLTIFHFPQNAVQLISKKNILYIPSCCVQPPLSNNLAACLGNLPYSANILLHFFACNLLVPEERLMPFQFWLPDTLGAGRGNAIVPVFCLCWSVFLELAGKGSGQSSSWILRLTQSRAPIALCFF